MAQPVQLVLTPIGVAFFGLYIYSVPPSPSFWSIKVPPSLAVWGKTMLKFVIKQANPTCVLLQDNSCRPCVYTWREDRTAKILQHGDTIHASLNPFLPDILVAGTCGAEIFLLEAGCIILFTLSIVG